MHAPLYVVRYLGFMLLPVQRTGIAPLPDLVRQFIGVAAYIHVVLGVGGMLVLLALILKGTCVWRALGVWLALWLVPFSLVRMPESWLELRYLYFASIPFCGLLGHGFDVTGPRLGARSGWIRHALIAGLVCAAVVIVTLLERQYDRFQG